MASKDDPIPTIPATKPSLGAHMSITGGLDRAVARIASLEGTALQLFTRNQRQWKIPPVSDEERRLFHAAVKKWGGHPVAAHDSYLINLASPEADKAERSIQAFARELDRVEQLGIPYLVTHPGSHMKQGVEAGISRYVANLDRAIADSVTTDAMVLLETTAGQGTNLGSTFEELAAIIRSSSHADRLGVCLDTCHAFCAGYDFRTPRSLDRTLEDFDRTIGLSRLRFLHLNDSKNPLGSHKDRHEHIGQGAIGLQAFGLILNHPGLQHIPMVLETPKDKDLEDDRKNLQVLRGLLSS